MRQFSVRSRGCNCPHASFCMVFLKTWFMIFHRSVAARFLIRLGYLSTISYSTQQVF